MYVPTYRYLKMFPVNITNAFIFLQHQTLPKKKTDTLSGDNLQAKPDVKKQTPGYFCNNRQHSLGLLHSLTII